ncbi:MAG: NAD-dependent epimerase/dehydratase family protein [Bacteroidales bacterium]|nr:NAD-dependent epimerase/dehydratase family protein [Bacteroidales bacterium]
MIAVTGSTGFVGSHLLIELLKKDLAVVAFKRDKSDVSYTQKVFQLQGVPQLFKKIHWVDCHLSKYNDVFEAFNGIDIVFHAAAQVDLNGKTREQMIKKNVKITENVVNAALLHRVKRFCYVSSIASITNNIDGIGRENAAFEILKTDHPYTISKCLAELEVWRGIQEGLPAVIVNPSVILGYSRQWKTFTSIVKRLQEGQYYYPCGSGSFVDISDVVKIMTHLTFNTSITNERFILTSENISYKKLYTYICEELKINTPLKPIGKKKLLMLGYVGEAISLISKKNYVINLQTAKLLNKDLAYSNDKIKDVLQYSFIPVKESIKKMLAIKKLSEDYKNKPSESL